MRNLYMFAVASLLPALCIVVACFWGGVWPLVAALSISVVVTALDLLTANDWSPPKDSNGHILSAVIGVVHFVVLGASVWALGAGDHLSLFSKVLIFVAVGLWAGQVSNSNAHELIHRRANVPRRLGVAVYMSLLFGHHASAHPKVHHVHVATDLDPNSARLNETFYRYFLRAWTGGFSAGYHAENVLRARAATPKPPWSHPYIGYVSGALGAVIAAFLIAGGAGMLALIAIAFYAQTQLFLSDYVQHYGLRRQTMENGRTEPVGPQHSWNAPHWYSGVMMLNAPRHSDHHVHTQRSFPELELHRETMPMLPYSVPIMASVALFPSVWKRVMNPRVAQWSPAEPNV